MQSLLAVSAGSDRPPRVVMLEHNRAPAGTGAGADRQGSDVRQRRIVAQPTDGMLTMKCDMAGAAACWRRWWRSPAGVACPRPRLHGTGGEHDGGSAMKLAMSSSRAAGVTIEVLNTDAEGLVLADVLDYAVTQGAPTRW